MKRKKSKKPNLKKRITIIAITAIILWILSFYIYTTYQNIEINPTNYETQKLQSTQSEQTV